MEPAPTVTGKLTVICTGCGIEHKLPPTAAGRRIGCPACGSEILIGKDGTALVLDAPGKAPAPAVEPPSPDAPAERPAPPPIPLRDMDQGPGPEGFFPRLNKAFLFPVSSGSGILFLVTMAFAWSFARIFGIGFSLAGVLGLILRIIIGGYIAAYLFQILHASGNGEEKAPDMPDVGHVDELAGNFFRFFGATLIAFLPAFALLLLGTFLTPGIASAGWFTPALIGLLIFGVFYYPMTLMLTGFFHSMLAPLNYLFGVRTALRIPKHYFVCTLYFLATFIGAWALEAKVLAALSSSLSMFFAASVAISLIELYLYALQMRALGVLYYCNRRELALFG